MTASSADLRCLFIKKQTNKTNAYIKPATEIDQHPSYPKVNNHVNAPIATMTTDSSIDFAVFSSCTIVHFIEPHCVTVSLCDSNAINYESTMSTSLQSHTPHAYINPTHKSKPASKSTRKQQQQQNNPSKGETNAYINPTHKSKPTTKSSSNIQHPS